MNPSARLLQFFRFSHLPEGQGREVSRKFFFFASSFDDVPENAEKTTGLRKLLEAKDCMVRATFFKEESADVLENLRVHDVAEGPVTPSNLTS